MNKKLAAVVVWDIVSWTAAVRWLRRNYYGVRTR